MPLEDRSVAVTLATVVNALGGLALFLLAMQMMTEGLKVYAGGGLKRLLGQWTHSPARGVFAGILVTGLVQSSSAVTVATIGFVNAGVLTMRQSLGVIFGANVGTTMTGWLVSLVGVGFRVDAVALPILAAGVALRLAAPRTRHRGLGEALAGFGLFFLGLSLLKDAFGGLADSVDLGFAGSAGQGRWAASLAVGIAITVLTQSSSAAIAIILTAAAGAVVGLEAAAAAVIGASLGTTSTAAVAVVKATPSARRLALAHIAFNVLAGGLAFALLQPMLWGCGRLAGWLDIERSAAAILALFHTAYKALGVAIMLPLTGRFATLLERLFRSAEEDLGQPRHLDGTTATTPALAVSALREELLRLRAVVTGVVEAALDGPSPVLERRSAAARGLSEAVTAFVGAAGSQPMPEDLAEDLARGLRTTRYLQEAARLSPTASLVRARAVQLDDDRAHATLDRWLASAGQCLALWAEEGPASARDADHGAALAAFRRGYRETKEALLGAAVAGRLPIHEADALLDAMSATRRLVEQLVKANRMLASPARAADIEAESADAEQP